MKKGKTIYLFIMICIGMFTFYLEDAELNRIEANTYLVCAHEVGKDKCYKGLFTNPSPEISTFNKG